MLTGCMLLPFVGAEFTPARSEPKPEPWTGICFGFVAQVPFAPQLRELT